MDSKVQIKMENKLMLVVDKLLLKKRMLIEYVIDQPKNVFLLKHSRHWSFAHFFVSVAAALIAYTYQEKKPSLNLENSQGFSDLIIRTC